MIPTPSPSRMPSSDALGLSQFPITVLLVDDQNIIVEAVRRMLEPEKDITFHACTDPTQALEIASLVQPTVILQDLVMPDVDGLTLVKFYRVHPATRDTPLIVLSSREEPAVKAEAFALGANDYLVKLPDRIELIARIRYHSRGYISLLQRNEAYQALAQSQQKLQEQLAAASRFVESLLPAPSKGPISTDWRFIPSADLGGDTFGYHWLDDNHFVLYLIDVTGHGLDSAFLSVSIMNVLRSRALPSTDFRMPGQVLAALNDAFPMEEYGGKCFTIWYGVYNKSTRDLQWAGGGHPPGLLYEEEGAAPVQLESNGPMMGMMPWPEWDSEQRPIPSGSCLYVYTDGVFEIHKVDGGEWTFDEMVKLMSEPEKEGISRMDRLLLHCHMLHGSEMLDDDYSIVEFRFD